MLAPDRGAKPAQLVRQQVGHAARTGSEELVHGRGSLGAHGSRGGPRPPSSMSSRRSRGADALRGSGRRCDSRPRSKGAPAVRSEQRRDFRLVGRGAEVAVSGRRRAARCPAPAAPARGCRSRPGTATGFRRSETSASLSVRRAAPAFPCRRRPRGNGPSCSAKHEPSPRSRPMALRHSPASRALPSRARAARPARCGMAHTRRPRPLGGPAPLAARDANLEARRRPASRRTHCSTRRACAADGWRSARGPSRGATRAAAPRARRRSRAHSTLRTWRVELRLLARTMLCSRSDRARGCAGSGSCPRTATHRASPRNRYTPGPSGRSSARSGSAAATGTRRGRRGATSSRRSGPAARSNAASSGGSTAASPSARWRAPHASP